MVSHKGETFADDHGPHSCPRTAGAARLLRFRSMPPAALFDGASVAA
jgi:hypothetical protein